MGMFRSTCTMVRWSIHHILEGMPIFQHEVGTSKALLSKVIDLH